MYGAVNFSLFRILSDPTRVKILTALLNKNMSVMEMVEQLNLDQPLISHHLKQLREHNIVDVERVGKLHVYSVRPEKRKVLELILKMSSTESKEDMVEILLSELKDELTAYLGDKMASNYAENIRSKVKGQER